MCAAKGETPCQVRLARLLLHGAAAGDREYLQALAWLDLAEEHGNAQARMMLDQERAELSPEQAAWVKRLKEQFGKTF